ncbi:MAG: hypothetical protein MJ232_04645 [archaeon]|nr:hypothetical protein [archaeon]
MNKLNYLIYLSRITLISAIIVVVFNEFHYKNSLLAHISILLLVISVISLIISVIMVKKGIDNGTIGPSSKIILETNVEEALKNGLITEEQAKEVPETIVIESRFLFLNLVFNLAINCHFDPLPVEVLHDALPTIPPIQLKGFYAKAQEINDELNDYFRSQKYSNKADVISHSKEIKEYLVQKYPWMMADTVQNTYNYFFLGIGNG